MLQLPHKSLLISLLCLGFFIFFIALIEVTSLNAAPPIKGTAAKPSLAQPQSLSTIICTSPRPLTFPSSTQEYRAPSLFGRLIVFEGFDSTTNQFFIYAYDMGQNERIELTTQGNPTGDDRGFFILNNATRYANAQQPAIYDHTLVYVESDPAQPLTALIQYELGSDGLVGTADDIISVIEDSSSVLGYTYLHIAQDIITWQAQITTSPPVLTALYACSLSLNGQQGGCSLPDQKTLIAPATPGVSRYQFFSDGFTSTPTYLWSETASPSAPYAIFSSISNQIASFQSNPNLNILITDSLFPFYLFFESSLTNPAGGSLYLGLVVSPSFKIPISTTGLNAQARFSPMTFLRQQDPKFIVWQEGPLFGNKRIMLTALSTTTPYAYPIVDVSQDSLANNYQPAVSGNTVIFVKRPLRQTESLYYAQCYS